MRCFIPGLVVLLMATWNSGAAADRFVSFEWSGGQSAGAYCPKAAIYVSVNIPGDDRKFQLQMDTGCESSFVYGDLLRRFGCPVDSGTPDLLITWYAPDTTIGLMRVPIWWRDRIWPSIGKDDPVEPMRIGTLGSNAFVGRILALDFPSAGFAVYNDTGEIPSQLRGNLDFLQTEIRDNRFMISIRLGSDTLREVMFHTGASTFSLLLDENEWRHYTGLRGDEPEVTVDSVPAWDNMWC